MRFADIDSLNHVNNVAYLDYAAESRALLVDVGLVSVDEQPSRISIDFMRPMFLSRDPVRIESRREGDELFQIIRPAQAAHDFARVRTTLGGSNEFTRQPGVTSSTLNVRRSDLDRTGAVRTDKMFELFQETRISVLASALASTAADRFVVAHVEVEYGLPLRWRRDPYRVLNWVSRVGTSSTTIGSQIVDGDAIVAQCHSTLVGYDLAAQGSRRLSEQERSALRVLQAPARTRPGRCAFRG